MKYLAICIDSWRKDRLGVYGLRNSITPNLDTIFNKHGVVCSRYYSNSNWTPSVILTLFLRKYLFKVGIYGDGGMAKLRDNGELRKEAMKSFYYKKNSNNYAISSNPWVTKTFGFGEKFNKWDYVNNSDCRCVIKKFDEEVKPKLKDGDFVYLHFMDVHVPYYFGVNSQDAVNEERYDKSVKWFDGEFSKFLDSINKDEYSIVIFGDHGEEFVGTESKATHGHNVEKYMINTPLVFMFPGTKGYLNNKLIQTKDLLRILLKRKIKSCPYVVSQGAYQNRVFSTYVDDKIKITKNILSRGKDVSYCSVEDEQYGYYVDEVGKPRSEFKKELDILDSCGEWTNAN